MQDCMSTKNRNSWLQKVDTQTRKLPDSKGCHRWSTHVDHPGRITLLEVVEHSGLVQKSQHRHVLDLVELGRVLLQHLVLLHGHRLQQPTHRATVSPPSAGIRGGRVTGQWRLREKDPGSHWEDTLDIGNEKGYLEDLDPFLEEGKFGPSLGLCGVDPGGTHLCAHKVWGLSRVASRASPATHLSILSLSSDFATLSRHNLGLDKLFLVIRHKDILLEVKGPGLGFQPLLL